MGQIFRLTDAGNHISTGKYPYHAGEIHVPQWGEPRLEHGFKVSYCLFPDCDREDWHDIADNLPEPNE